MRNKTMISFATIQQSHGSKLRGAAVAAHAPPQATVVGRRGQDDPGKPKLEAYQAKFGKARVEAMTPQMAATFQQEGLPPYSMARRPPPAPPHPRCLHARQPRPACAPSQPFRLLTLPFPLLHVCARAR